MRPPRKSLRLIAIRKSPVRRSCGYTGQMAGPEPNVTGAPLVTSKPLGPPSPLATTEPLVTIVTPSFEQARFLPDAIESVAAQGRPDIEHIVIDGGSRDGSVEILRRQGDRLRWISEPDGGQADAINKGFAMARGQIFGWINSDDILLPGAVDAAVEAFRADPWLGLVYGQGYTMDEQGRRLEPFALAEPFNLRRLIHFGDTILQQTAFFRRSAFEAVGGLDAGLYWALDWDLFIRLGGRFPARMLEREMGVIRLYDSTKTASGGLRRVREIRAMLARHAGGARPPAYWGAWLDAWNSRLESACDKRLPRSLRRFGRRVVRNAHDWAARRIFPRMEECCGWLHDGWAVRSVELLLPRLPSASIELDGEQPSGGGELRLLLDGVEAWRETPRPGRFRRRIEIPEARAASALGPLQVRVDAERVVRTRARLHGGRQRLCWKLFGVTLDSAEGRVAPPPPRLLLSPDVESLGAGSGG